MAKDQEKAARQSYAAKAKDKGHRAHKFELEGFKSNARTPDINTAIAMSARNKQKMVGSAVAGAIRTPSLL